MLIQNIASKRNLLNLTSQFRLFYDGDDVDDDQSPGVNVVTVKRSVKRDDAGNKPGCSDDSPSSLHETESSYTHTDEHIVTQHVYVSNPTSEVDTKK